MQPKICDERWLTITDGAETAGAKTLEKSIPGKRKLTINKHKKTSPVAIVHQIHKRELGK